ncbi:MAG: hypothetical protein FWH11_14930 [Micrococcales bacterium]|nr:hypothetical protein [Micrococcales bacterium]
MMRRARVLGVAVVAVMLTAGACQTAGPASPPTTRTPTPFRNDIAFADAEAAYRNYAEVADQVSQDYYRGWQEKLEPLVSEESVPNWGEFFSEGEAGGYHIVGSDVIDSVEARQYKEDDRTTGRETVELRVCIDSTDVQELSPDGADTLGEGTAGRFFHVVTMKHEPELGGNGVPLPDADDPCGQSWWRWAGATTWYETC